MGPTGACRRSSGSGIQRGNEAYRGSPRTYTQSHIDYVIEVAGRVARRSAGLTGMRIVSQPRQLRHFTARFAPLP